MQSKLSSLTSLFVARRRFGRQEMPRVRFPVPVLLLLVVAATAAFVRSSSHANSHSITLTLTLAFHLNLQQNTYPYRAYRQTAIANMDLIESQYIPSTARYATEC